MTTDANIAPQKRRRSSLEKHPEHDWVVSKLRFWLGLANLRKSDFLAGIILADDNPLGWVGVDTLLTFNTLIDAKVKGDHVLSAAAALPGILTVDFRRRAVRLVDGRVSVALARSAGAAEEDTRTLVLSPLPRNISRIELLDVLGKPSKVVYVTFSRPQRQKKGPGCGSAAFVVFETAEDAAAFSAALPARALRKFPLLQAIAKSEWRDGKSGSASVQQRDSETPKVRKVEPVATDDVAAPEPRDDYVKAEIEFEAGVVVKATGYPLPTSQKELRSLFESLGGPVAYVDFLSSAPDTCFCRFRSADSARKALEAELPLKIEFLVGKEELEYWEKVHSLSKEKRGKSSRGRRKRTG